MDTHQQKISHLKALYYLAHADKEFSKVEEVYIRNVAEKLGVDMKEIENYNGDEPSLELPDREYKNYSLFHRLAIVIMLDNKVSKDEKDYCFNLGIKMGLHPNAIEEVLDLIMRKGAVSTMPSEIIAIFKRYMS